MLKSFVTTVVTPAKWPGRAPPQSTSAPIPFDVLEMTLRRPAGAVTTVLTGVTSGSGVGEPAITLGLTVAAVGVSSSSAIGEPAVAPGAATTALTGVASGSAFGQPAVSTGATSVVLAGAASGSAVGVPVVSGGVPAVLLTGVVSASAFGLVTVVRETIDYGIRAAPHRVSMTVPGDLSTIT